MNELALFAGAGGGILGGKLLGWNTIAAVEIEEYPRKVLLQRQRDGILEPFPIWDDIKAFDGRPWKGCVDIVSGGFPCQDISAAGKGAGIDGERSGLWGEMARVINEVRPRFTFVENSPMLTIRGLGRVLGDLSEMGYDARWCVLGADDAGAPHRRKRIWILAYTQSRESGKQTTGDRRESISGRSKEMAYTDNDRSYPGPFGKSPDKKRREKQNGPITQRSQISWWDTDPADIPDTDKFNDDNGGSGTGPICRERSGQAEILGGEEMGDTSESQLYNARKRNERKRRKAIGLDCSSERSIKPKLGRVAHGVAHRVDRLKAIGNGQVPGVEAIAFTILSEGLIV